MSVAEYWEMDQEEYHAAVEGYQKRVDDQLMMMATQACWVVNSIPIPFVKSRKTMRPKQLLGKSEGTPAFTSPDAFKAYMRNRANSAE